jgi:hypothetical protein
MSTNRSGPELGRANHVAALSLLAENNALGSLGTAVESDKKTICQRCVP